MKDTAKVRRRSQETTAQLTFAAMMDARATLHDVVMRSGMAIVAAMLEDDRELFCGRRYVHDRSRAATRAGYADGELALGGRRVTIRRPRVRNAQGEVALPTWEHFASADPLTPLAMEQMILGVSTCNYCRSIEPAPTGRPTVTSRETVTVLYVPDANTLENFEYRASAVIPVFQIFAMLAPNIWLPAFFGSAESLLLPRLK